MPNGTIGVESEDFLRNPNGKKPGVGSRPCCELTDFRSREPFRNDLDFQVGILPIQPEKYAILQLRNKKMARPQFPQPIISWIEFQAPGWRPDCNSLHGPTPIHPASSHLTTNFPGKKTFCFPWNPLNSMFFSVKLPKNAVISRHRRLFGQLLHLPAVLRRP